MDLPDYYSILSIQNSASLTSDDIRNAYKKASLLTHPDRKPNLTDSEKKRSTFEFQRVADAYYVLSNPKRKKEYDLSREEYLKFNSTNQEEHKSSSSFFHSFFSHSEPDEHQNHHTPPDPNQTFTSVFEEMLNPEVEKVIPLWKYLGTASGATLGFILGSIPGLAIGSYAGNRLGSIRDAKGKSVSAVFLELDSVQKATILKGLAIKVLGHALS
ncbi:DnaJ domain-containing protein [Melampsora americana]|nr:DnaJ domain-containing protein [Melampsora americana]